MQIISLNFRRFRRCFMCYFKRERNQRNSIVIPINSSIVPSLQINRFPIQKNENKIPQFRIVYDAKRSQIEFH